MARAPRLSRPAALGRPWRGEWAVRLRNVMGSTLVGAALLLGTSGCTDRRSQVLLVYSGDCQAYIEPCG